MKCSGTHFMTDEPSSRVEGQLDRTMYKAPVIVISPCASGVGGIDKYNTSVFLEKILQYNYIPTIGVADLQAPLNNMLQSS